MGSMGRWLGGMGFRLGRGGLKTCVRWFAWYWEWCLWGCIVEKCSRVVSCYLDHLWVSLIVLENHNGTRSCSFVSLINTLW